MNAEELAIYEFLRSFPGSYVSLKEICQRAGKWNHFAQDRNWAHSILRRMELDGVIESNNLGDYRVKGSETTTFRQALQQPGQDLGETTIIMLGERPRRI